MFGDKLEESSLRAAYVEDMSHLLATCGPCIDLPDEPGRIVGMTKHLPTLGAGMSIKLLNIREVAESLGVVPQTIRRWIQAGQFPPPISLGGATIRWRESEIELFLDEQSALAASLAEHFGNELAASEVDQADLQECLADHENKLQNKTVK